MRLLDAYLGTSGFVSTNAKWPLRSKIAMPFGLSPKGRLWLPSLFAISTETYVQLPTICCLSDAARAGVWPIMPMAIAAPTRAMSVDLTVRVISTPWRLLRSGGRIPPRSPATDDDAGRAATQQSHARGIFLDQSGRCCPNWDTQRIKLGQGPINPITRLKTLNAVSTATKIKIAISTVSVLCRARSALSRCSVNQAIVSSRDRSCNIPLKAG